MPVSIANRIGDNHDSVRKKSDPSGETLSSKMIVIVADPSPIGIRADRVSGAVRKSSGKFGMFSTSSLEMADGTLGIASTFEGVANGLGLDSMFRLFLAAIAMSICSCVF